MGWACLAPLGRYSADATAQEEAMDAGTGSGSQSVSAANDEEREQPPRPAIHAARAGPEDLKRLGGAQDTGRGSVDGGSGRTKRSATELDDGTDAAARKAGGGSDVLSQRSVDARQGQGSLVSWAPPGLLARSHTFSPILRPPSLAQSSPRARYLKLSHLRICMRMVVVITAVSRRRG